MIFMSGKYKAHIIGIGSYLPDQILTNADLEKMVDTSDEWIISRTGIEQRRIAHKNEFPSDMGAVAAERALINANKKSEDLDLIIVATMSPDYITPSTANVIQGKLGASQAAALDIQAACSGFLFALSMAKAYVESGLYKVVLVIATEKMSAFIDYSDRNTCVLFGDGASACIVSAEEHGLQIDNVSLGTDGTLADLVMIPGGGARHPTNKETIENRLHYFRMNGKEVFKHAIRRMNSAAEECLKRSNVTQDEICWLVPHQANKRIIDALTKSFALPEEKVFKTVHKYGNTSASSIGIALDELLHQQKVQKGEKLLLLAFGGGLTWGASLLTKK